MLIINIGEFVSFAINYGVMISRGAEQLSPEELHKTLLLALKHIDDPLLVDSCYGGIGPFKDYFRLNFEEYLEQYKKFESELQLKRATQRAKNESTKIRRSGFNRNRAHIVLAMIEHGILYKCCHPECCVTEHLTVDHVLPLSKGGTDDIKNLLFMCRSHNSAKSDTYDG